MCIVILLIVVGHCSDLIFFVILETVHIYCFSFYQTSTVLHFIIGNQAINEFTIFNVVDHIVVSFPADCISRFTSTFSLSALRYNRLWQSFIVEEGIDLQC